MPESSDQSHVETQGAPEFLTVEEAAKALRLSRNGTYEAIRKEEIPSVRIGRRILVPVDALKRLCASCET